MQCSTRLPVQPPLAGGKHEGLGYLSMGVAVRCVICGFYLFIYSSRLCCPLRFQNSPQTCRWEGFPVFGNFSSFKTLSPGQVSVPNSFVSFLSFVFCPTSFRRQWVAFLGAWYPPPAFRSCLVVFAQCSNDFLMNLWGRKWSPHPIPLSS